jgi:diguanylate cyclase (GGDEF)-like protein/PAS domain S-box-containing protein
MKSLFKRNDLQIALIYAVVTGTAITIFDYLLAESSQTDSVQLLIETVISWAFVTAFSLGILLMSHKELLRGPLIEKELSLGQDELKNVLRYLPVMLLSVDRKGKIILAESRGLKQAGFEAGELMDQPASRFYELFVTNRQRGKAIPWKQLTERVFAGETVLATTEWNGRYYENRFSAIQTHSAHVDGIIWVVIDVTEHKRGEEVLLIYYAIERRQAEEKLFDLAMHDLLTGLPNRVLLYDRLHHAFERSRRKARDGNARWKLAVMMLDLDNFKGINDRYGHEAGDKALQQVARRLEACLRHSDSIARWGGDEFVIVLEGIRDRSDCQSVTQKILASLNTPPLFEEKGKALSATIGISLFPDDAEDFDTLLRYADQSMYSVKKPGNHPGRSGEIAA